MPTSHDIPDWGLPPSAGVACVRCTHCGESWWVRPGAEFTPKLCCYCGAEFDRVLGTDMVLRTLAGHPAEIQGAG